MKFRNVDKKRLMLVVVSVIIMGASLAFLYRTDFGTDACSCLNLGISTQLGMTLGNWQVIFNCILFIFVILFAKNQIGWGTLANMFLVGYSFDFFSWLLNQVLPADFFTGMITRIAVTIPALFIFVISAATYMAVELGTAPYDAIPFIVASKIEKVPFRIVRIIWDVTSFMIGWALGSTLGVVTVIMAFTLGPVITWIKEHVIDKYVVLKS